MNWLAHLRLAPDDPELRLGALLGDFARGAEVAALPPRVQAGIAHHRAIDRFTDAHAVFVQSRARIAAPWRRFAGVLVDVFYDHFLARDWDVHGDGSALRAFTATHYELLQQHRALLPAALLPIADRMQQQDWLASYAEVPQIDVVLGRMARRLRRETTLGSGGEQLRAHYDELGRDFVAFFADVRTFADELARGLAAAT